MNAAATVTKVICASYIVSAVYFNIVTFGIRVAKVSGAGVSIIAQGVGWNIGASSEGIIANVHCAIVSVIAVGIICSVDAVSSSAVARIIRTMDAIVAILWSGYATGGVGTRNLIGRI